MVTQTKFVAIASIICVVFFSCQRDNGEDLLRAGWIARGHTRYEEAEQKFEQALILFEQSDDHQGAADALSGLGLVSCDRGRCFDSLSFYDRAWALYLKQTDKTGEQRCLLLQNFGRAHAALDEHAQAVDKLTGALEMNIGLHGTNHRANAIIQGEICAQYVKLDNHTKALTFCTQALKADKGDLETLGILDMMASSWDAIGQYDKAIEYGVRALKLRKKKYGDEYPDVAVDLGNLAAYHTALNQHEKAITYLVQALAIDTSHYGQFHKDTATDLSRLGNAYKRLKLYEQASKYYELALETKRRIWGEHHPSVAATLNSIAGVQYRLGNAKEAYKNLEQVLFIFEEQYGRNDPRVATILNNLGGVLYSMGRHREAIEYLESALKVDSSIHGYFHASIAGRMDNLGVAWQKLGYYEKAVGYHEQALTIRQELYGENAISIAGTCVKLGRAFEGLGNFKEAIRQYDRALQLKKKSLGESHFEVLKISQSIESLKKKSQTDHKNSGK